MEPNTKIDLKREVDAIQIPSGDSVKLSAGTPVIIMQSLGGTYTVATDYGLARISEQDKDALGIEEKSSEQPATTKVNTGAPVTEEELRDAVWEQLKSVYDPEIPVNIVDLGLVYDCRIEEEDDNKVVLVKMTLTAPGCGMGPTIAEDARSRIVTIDGIDEARVELVWEPAWNQDMISEQGKMELGLI